MSDSVSDTNLFRKFKVLIMNEICDYQKELLTSVHIYKNKIILIDIYFHEKS